MALLGNLMQKMMEDNPELYRQAQAVFPQGGGGGGLISQLMQRVGGTPSVQVSGPLGSAVRAAGGGLESAPQMGPMQQAWTKARGGTSGPQMQSQSIAELMGSVRQPAQDGIQGLLNSAVDQTAPSMQDLLAKFRALFGRDPANEQELSLVR